LRHNKAKSFQRISLDTVVVILFEIIIIICNYDPININKKTQGFFLWGGEQEGSEAEGVYPTQITPR
jgi:hypothetical protein